MSLTSVMAVVVGRYGGVLLGSIWSGSRAAGLSSASGVLLGLVGGGHSGQSLLLAECGSPQFEQLAGEARQPFNMALRLRQEGHGRLGQ